MDSRKNRPQNNAGTQGNMERLLLVVGGGIIVLVGLVVLITWLALKHHKPKYYLDHVSVSQFKITHDGFVNSKVLFNITTRNPNKKVVIYYDQIDAFLLYDGQEIAWASISPFFQGHNNTTFLHTPLSGYSNSLQPDTSTDLKLERCFGKINMVFRLYARIRFKVGRWKCQLNFSTRLILSLSF